MCMLCPRCLLYCTHCRDAVSLTTFSSSTLPSTPSHAHSGDPSRCLLHPLHQSPPAVNATTHISTTLSFLHLCLLFPSSQPALPPSPPPLPLPPHPQSHPALTRQLSMGTRTCEMQSPQPLGYLCCCHPTWSSHPCYCYCYCHCSLCCWCCWCWCRCWCCWCPWETPCLLAGEQAGRGAQQWQGHGLCHPPCHHPILPMRRPLLVLLLLH